MNPSRLIINPEIDRLIERNNFSDAIKILFTSQLDEWEDLSKAYSDLKETKVKSFLFDDFNVNVQFNPNRILSTSAKTDYEAVKKRKCFLCDDNLSEKQKGINYNNLFLILCNPFPIFPEHFTIASFSHQPQNIEKHFEEYLNLARHLSPSYTIIYNGAQCGASAPDHLHFQAGTKNYLPLETDFNNLKNKYSKVLDLKEEITISFVQDGLRKMIFIESIKQDLIIKWLIKIFNSLKIINNSSNEPLINSVCGYDEREGWRVTLFLRSKHRPDFYFRDDESKYLVSPAAVDLSGIIVTPREIDFEKLDETLIRRIFNEVSLDDEKFIKLEEMLI